MFALVADGKNGLRVLQVISPDTCPATWVSARVRSATHRHVPTHGEALAITRGLDRDRVVDETGNQTVVFGRRGARPFKAEEMEASIATYARIIQPPAARRNRQTVSGDDITLRDGHLRLVQEQHSGRRLNSKPSLNSFPAVRHQIG